MNSKTMRILALVLFALGLALYTTMAIADDKPAADAPKKATYVGSDKCKICHKGERHGLVFDKWLESKHSKAMAALKTDKEDNTANEKCLKCHTTGYGKGGYDAMKEMQDPEKLGAVGCEVCHGPGSEYKSAAVMKDKAKAIAEGLIIPDAKTCTGCHNSESPTFKGEFKFDEMFAKIKHTIPDSLKSK